ncbi:trehalase family glycosidase [Aestuariibaculum sediminum]|uniref:Trehalase n=1 Tax=Aestuariibaculum sediminum TaxID=2770637 RepID=A0A8J6QLN0_9FLAO|nr:trehalase family glycosidase [Aestuariibaculum sediminum]MBD0833484.1 trehalase [Aestuariibaculum sediminum]
MKLLIHRDKLIELLINQEDTTGSYTITVEDHGKKSLIVDNINGEPVTIEGTYYLANLLQETALLNEETGVVNLEHVFEAPVTRLSRVIKDYYWDKLTRSFDDDGLLEVLEDEKMQGDYLRLYVPESDINALQFYKKKTEKHSHVKVEAIPENISKELILALNQKPGILSLAYSQIQGHSRPFVVPGGRFNEMYGWDSYFISLGLIIDDKFELAQSMIDNLEYQIIHYGKILNANRSYYLSRSQPPFFSSFIKEMYTAYAFDLPEGWLKQKLCTAITEYFNVWMTKGVRLTENGLNRYFGEGQGAPSETEPGHFDAILKIYAKKHNLPLEEFKAKYDDKQLIDEDLDMYFVHDRSMRESGHDTTNRLDGCSAHLNTVDLNSLLYKYESDIAYFIEHCFDDNFTFKGETFSSKDWYERANHRKGLMDKFMWNKEMGCYYDYNFKTQEQQPCSSASNFYPLWANLCSQEQANKLLNHLPEIAFKGGIVSTARLVMLPEDMPDRQWDFPFGWAPHQMLIWEGLENYDFHEKSQELIYRWLWLIVKTAVDYNGLIPEKFDVFHCTHEVNVEYGNVGTNFKYVPDGGFGWTNASFKLGVKLLDEKYIKLLNAVTDPDVIFK